jgi:HEAT repeat protein
MRWFFCAVTLLFVGLFYQVGWSQEKQPDTKLSQVAGKTLEQWIKEIGSVDPSKRENAIRTVLLFGPDRAYQAVPAILDQLRKHDPVSNPVDASVRVNAALALGVIIGGTKEPDAKQVKAAVTQLKRLMGDSQSIVRYRAAQALGRIGPDARDTIPELISATKNSSNWEIRRAAVYALGFVAREEKKVPGEDVINALVGALGDKIAQVRQAAIESLIWIASPADLAKVLAPIAQQDPDPTVRERARKAIQLINP